MKEVVKKKLTRSQRSAIILSSVLAGLIIISIVLSIVYAHVMASKDNTKEPLDIREELGESEYVGIPIAYSRLEERQFRAMSVSNKNGKFYLTRPNAYGEFWISYDLGEGDEVKWTQYIPPIVDAEGEFNYETLYSLDETDGYGKYYMLSRLCSAVGTVYFQERIDLPVIEEGDSEEVKEQKRARRQELLEEYGLVGEGASVVSFAYAELDEEKKLILKEDDSEYPQRHITIGDSALNGQGFYYRVDGRDCIYYTSFDTLGYALMGVNSFIKGTLVSAGLAEDTTFEPILTTDFKEWHNTVYESGSVAAGSSVVAKGDALLPIKESAEYKPEDHPDGYYVVVGEQMSFDLGEAGEDSDSERLIGALLGASVGDHSSSPIYITNIMQPNESVNTVIDFGDKDSVRYSYEIVSLEAILDYADASGKKLEKVDTGTPVGSSKLVRVAYNCSIDGKRINTVSLHAVMDLSLELIPEAARAAVAASSVGTLSEAISFEIEYTKDNAIASLEEIVITDIIGIYDKKGAPLEKVTEDSYVDLRYFERINGEDGETKSLTVKISDVKDDEKWGGLASALLGRSKGSKLNITAISVTKHHEALSEFTTYVIKDIECYIESELIVSFRFLNEKDRDPFFGESLYENNTTGYKNYGLNAETCQNVLRIVGGLGADTSHSVGLSGSTVAIGLTHERMKEYGLYDYTIYFELPRGIYDATYYENMEESGAEDVDDVTEFAWRGTLGFHLYVSKPDPSTGKRYVGSDMYDLVVEIAGDAFDFLDYSFSEFWARENVMLVRAENLASLEIDFNMEDLKGGYNFEINEKTYYYYGIWDGKPVWNEIKAEGAVGSESRFEIAISLDEGEVTETKASKLIADSINGKTSAYTVYDKQMLHSNTIETLGASNFMLALQILQMTTYQGVLTEEEQAAGLASEKLMSLTMKLKEEVNDMNTTYVYNFYRVGDRKIMVSVSEVDAFGKTLESVSEFYLSTFSFKKVVYGYLSMLNGLEVNGDLPYPDEK
ncbi:MAG: hypothetical protein IKC32_02300 [Clostridia bacterium]|nr:hypothetical protein [Clostridia bacterium]